MREEVSSLRQVSIARRSAQRLPRRCRRPMLPSSRRSWYKNALRNAPPSEVVPGTKNQATVRWLSTERQEPAKTQNITNINTLLFSCRPTPCTSFLFLSPPPLPTSAVDARCRLFYSFQTTPRKISRLFYGTAPLTHSTSSRHQPLHSAARALQPDSSLVLGHSPLERTIKRQAHVAMSCRAGLVIRY